VRNVCMSTCPAVPVMPVVPRVPEILVMPGRHMMPVAV
jgi:hypothetical protein